MTAWHRVASEFDLNIRGPLTLTVAGQEIGLFAVHGQYYAIEDPCPHAYAYALLSQGKVNLDRVECPYHNAQFHIPSGRCIRGPGRDLRQFPVRVDEGQIYLELQLPLATDRQFNASQDNQGD